MHLYSRDFKSGNDFDSLELKSTSDRARCWEKSCCLTGRLRSARPPRLRAWELFRHLRPTCDKRRAFGLSPVILWIGRWRMSRPQNHERDNFNTHLRGIRYLDPNFSHKKAIAITPPVGQLFGSHMEALTLPTFNWGMVAYVEMSRLFPVRMYFMRLSNDLKPTRTVPW